MITVTAKEVEAMIRDDLDFLHCVVAQLDVALSGAAPSEARNKLIANNERLEIFLYNLPENIAAHGPFRDEDHLQRAAQSEVKRALVLLDSSHKLLTTVGTA